MNPPENEPPLTSLQTRKSRHGETPTPADHGTYRPRQEGSPAEAPLFQPEQVLARRYRIVRFIASGAHGQVYEAEDLEIAGPVALKTVRPEIASDPMVLDRFRRELQVARRVTHSNVCRLFDIEHHQDPAGPGSSGPGPPVLFLTMELLPGETLSERLRRAGPMSPEEALPLARQMAEALQAAHDAGVVHRDFKSGNVLLVPGGPNVRAVVTDFGVARMGALNDGDTASLTTPGDLVGTPAYMAPEQVEGGPVTAAADLYAFGVVLYEMVTGKRPFTADTSLSLMLKRLTEPPTSPRTHVAGLDPRWESAILRCLEKQPEDRFQNARDVILMLSGEKVAPAPRRRRRVKSWLAAGLAALVLGGLGSALYLSRARPPTLAATHRSAAILGFKNLSRRPDADWLSNVFTELLTMELGATTSGSDRLPLRILPGENVARMKMELEIPQEDTLAPDTLTRIRGNLGADLVLLGSYLALGEKSGGQIRLDLRVQETATGEVVTLVTASGTEGELLDLVSRTGKLLREKLELTAETGPLQASRPHNPEAARLYSEGLAKLRLFDALGARELLQKAVSADPGFVLAHWALAAAWSTLGHDAEAQEEARKAFELAEGLPRHEQLLVEGRYREIRGEWDRAVEIYGDLWDLRADNLDDGLQLAQVQIAAGRMKEALGSIERLRKLRPPDSEDPRIDLIESRAAASLSDFRRQLAAAERAVARGEARGAWHLVARALLEQGGALGRLGEPERTAECYRRAKRFFEEAGDRWGMARTINQMAGLPYDQGDFSTARGMFEESLALSRLIGDRRSVGRQLGNLAEALYNLGDLAGSTKMYEEAMAINRERGSKDYLADNLWGLAEVQAARGNLAGAMALYRECQDVAGEIGSKRYLAYAMDGIARVLLAQGKLPEARKAETEALELREQTGQKDVASISRLILAELALEAGDRQQAEGLARQAVEELARQSFKDQEAWASALLGEVLSLQGRQAEATGMLRHATELTAGSQSPHARLRVAIVAGRLRARSGEAEAAGNELESVIQQAISKDLVTLELEARLAWGEIASSSVQAESGRERLRALEKDAAARGFKLIASKAAAAH